MKCLIPLFSFIFIFSTHSFGQFQKGTWTINADSEAVFIKPSESTSGLALSTDIGYFPAKWLLVGTELSYSRFSYHSWAEHELSPSPYLRFYFNPNKKVKLYGQIVSQINLSFSSDSPLRREFSPEVGLGMNRFIGKNIAFEAGFNMASFTSIKFEDNRYSDFDKLTITPHLGMRLFLNTVGEQGIVNVEDNLQTDNYTFGLFGNSLHQVGSKLHSYNTLLNFQYFVAPRFSMGASLQYMGVVGFYGGEHLIGFSPTIEYYIPASHITQFVPSASATFLKDEPTTYNYGLKINTFVQSDISLWAGPFVLHSPQTFFQQWFFYLGAGANYFISGRKSKDKVKPIEQVKNRLFPIY